MLCAVLLLAAPASAQRFTQQGFVEWRGWAYPRAALNDSGRLTGEMRFRWDAGLNLGGGWALTLGTEAYADTHRQGRRDAGLFWFDHSLRRPIVAVRQAGVRYLRGAWRFEAGKQFIRWGQAEFYSPTDRFTPRDFLDPIESEILAVTAVRAVYSRGAGTLDAVFSPRLSPSRLPLPMQRWMQVPTDGGTAGYTFRDVGTEDFDEAAWGLRYHHAGHRLEWSASFFDGPPHTPNISLLTSPFRRTLKLLRRHPRLQMTGGDAAIPWRNWTFRGEAAYFRSSDLQADNYLQWVVEAERLAGRWAFAAGYSGENIVTTRLLRRLSPDRVFSNAAVARLAYAPSRRHEASLEALARNNGSGYGMRAHYSVSFEERWRLTLAGAWLDGDPATLIGRYSNNSGVCVRLRYSF